MSYKNGSEYVGGDTGLTAPHATRRGVFANHPAATPKYNTGNRDASLNYMARLFIPFSDPDARDKFVASFEGPAKNLADALATTGEKAPNVHGWGVGYIDFLLQQAVENYQEKFQAADVLSDNYVSYFFGQSPPVFQYQGTLLNSMQDNWRAAFTTMYHDIIRGTKLARKKLVVVLTYDDVFVTGVLVSMSQTLTAEFELAASFNFQLLVKRYDIVPRFGYQEFMPTPLDRFPYRVTGKAFASPLLQATDISSWNAGDPVYTAGQREKSKGQENKEDAMGYNASPADQYEQNTLYNSTIVNPVKSAFLVAQFVSDPLRALLGKK